MIDDRALRAADPAAGLRVEADSSQAQALLTDILASPRDGSVSRSKAPATFRLGRGDGRWTPRRRLTLGAGVLAPAAVVGAVAPVLWGGGAGRPAAAYAVTAKADGSVEVTVRWADVRDLDRLKGVLQKAGVPTAVTPHGASGYCDSAAERSQVDGAFSKLSASGVTGFEGYVLRPRLFPPGSTLVLAAFDDPVQKVHNVVLYLAPKDSTSCALSNYLGSTGYGPTPYRRSSAFRIRDRIERTAHPARPAEPHPRPGRGGDSRLAC